MSNNAQLLVKEHKGRFYVFSVMAEGWGEYDEKKGELVSRINHLSLNRAMASFDTREEAHKYAHKIDSDDPLGHEYGVVDEVLYKDQEPVVITELSQPTVSKVRKPSDSDNTTENAKSPTPEPTLQEQLDKLQAKLNNKRAYQIKDMICVERSDLITLIEKAERKARISELASIPVLSDPLSYEIYIENAIKELSGEEN